MASDESTVPAVIVIIFTIVNIGLASKIIYDHRHGRTGVGFDMAVTMIILGLLLIVVCIMIICEDCGVDESFLLWFTVIVFLIVMIMLGMYLCALSGMVYDTDYFPYYLCLQLFLDVIAICLIVILYQIK
ncbi:hypothetical protein SNEBB_003423 [Seison nebaliae]|nr:hypothetical protein SNEBB_003423 [Seison nebaliae]